MIKLHLIKIKTIHTFAIDINFLHSGEEKPTYLCHLSNYVLFFIWLDKFGSP
jgi:hypothetical protein